MTERELHPQTDEEAQAILDELRDEHPLNAAMIDLGQFVFYTEEHEGHISPQNALYLAAAAKQFVNLALAELNKLQDEIQGLEACSESILAAGTSGRA